MNEELNKMLLSFLQSTKEGVGKSIDFAQEQIPDVIHQLLLYNLIINLLFFSVGVIVLIYCYFIIQSAKVKPQNEEENFYWDWSQLSYSKRHTIGCGWFFPFFLAIVGVGLLLSGISWIEIVVAPKVYLLEYAAQLIKHGV